jgi:hypothetical protein
MLMLCYFCFDLDSGFSVFKFSYSFSGYFSTRVESWCPDVRYIGVLGMYVGIIASNYKVTRTVLYCSIERQTGVCNRVESEELNLNTRAMISRVFRLIQEYPCILYSLEGL